MCAWESFPRVCRGTELLGTLQTGQVTFSKLDVHHKSNWGAVPPIQFSGASHPECPQPCSFFSADVIIWVKPSLLLAFDSY